MLKETIFAATQKIRKRLGDDDWCVSVFEDNAGVVRFDDEFNVVLQGRDAQSSVGARAVRRREHRHRRRDPRHRWAPAWAPSRSATPTCSASPRPTRRPTTLPPGVLHPRRVMQGVVAGVRDYGNRMGIPTVNGAVYFDERYLGNPLVYCGNVGLIPRDKSHKQTAAGRPDRGRRRPDGPRRHPRRDVLSRRADQPERNALRRRGADRQRDHREDGARRAARGPRPRPVSPPSPIAAPAAFSSAVGEMGEKIGAEVHGSTARR